MHNVSGCSPAVTVNLLWAVIYLDADALSTSRLVSQVSPSNSLPDCVLVYLFVCLPFCVSFNVFLPIFQKTKTCTVICDPFVSGWTKTLHRRINSPKTALSHPPWAATREPGAWAEWVSVRPRGDIVVLKLLSCITFCSCGRWKERLSIIHTIYLSDYLFYQRYLPLPPVVIQIRCVCPGRLKPCHRQRIEWPPQQFVCGGGSFTLKSSLD